VIFDQKINRMIFDENKKISLMNNSIRCGYIKNDDIVYEDNFITSQYAIVYIISGEGLYRDDSGEISFSKGYLFQRFPEKIHSVTYFPGTFRFYIAVPSDIMNILKLSNSPILNKPVQNVGSTYTLYEEVGNLFNLCNSSESIYEILVGVQALISMFIKSSIDHYGVDGSYKQLIIKKAMVILKDMDCKMDLNEVALSLGLNYNTFRRVFKELTGLSPGHYRLNKRVENGVFLLINSNMSITEIAYKLKYSDIYTFSSQFKKVTGLSPTSFTKRFNKGNMGSVPTNVD